MPSLHKSPSGSTSSQIIQDHNGNHGDNYIQTAPSFSLPSVSDDTKIRLKHLTFPHVESYNYFLTTGLNDAIEDIPPMEFQLDRDKANSPTVKLYYTEAQINYPSKNDSLCSETRLTPREARERGMSYSGALSVSVKVELPDGIEHSCLFRCGDIPIMVMSAKCHLHGLSERSLVRHREESNELGGYFIVNGIERVIRLLQVPRRNYPMAIERSSFKKRGPAYTEKGVSMRCVRSDQSSVTVTLHFLSNGGATLRFTLRKQEFLLPVVVVAKALAPLSDQEFFTRVVQGDTADTFATARLELLLRDAKQLPVSTQAAALSYLGGHFRQFLPITDKCGDVEAGRMLIRRYLFVHVKEFGSKLECLLHMTRKLFAFAQDTCCADNPDALMHHEILLPGHLLTMYVKEKLEDIFISVRQSVLRDRRVSVAKNDSDISTVKYFQKHFDRFGSSIGSKVASFLSTGNIVSSTGLDLMQVSGYTIVAERLNILRYMSHFQSVHRGQFFTTMKTTLVRKLLPESWGFLCPVHTPDGSPCGLLSHLTREAIIIAYPTSEKLPPPLLAPLRLALSGVPSNLDIRQKKSPSHTCGQWSKDNDLLSLLARLGMTPAGTRGADGQTQLDKSYVPVLLDGVVLGGIHHTAADDFVTEVRLRKQLASGRDGVDPTMEVAYIPFSRSKNQPYAGVYLFTEPGRLVRPVFSLQHQAVEYIGPLEQVFMNIACTRADLRADVTHIEMAATAMLSQVASLTPFSDYNQSPRNMYQCQMGKQTMGTPAHALKHRADNKLFRILNVQAPLVQTKAQRDYCMDEYPQGANAVVAVISFTGYDMEDAMIINKASFERGFGHGCVYKTHMYDLDESERHGTRDGVRPSYRFGNVRAERVDPASGERVVELYHPHLDEDGLPCEGVTIELGMAVVCYIDSVSGQAVVEKHKESESCVIDTVRVIGVGGGASTISKLGQLRKVSITVRYQRNPIIGDKFSSRHGQKGTLSVLWPQENMPFTESGMSPDILINPHAFPSRMTIGMLIESMGGKAGSIHGKYQDGTPFQFHEDKRAIDFMGEQLRAAGYSYYGSEPLYNGLTGNVMHADIFIGVVFYQRLRHMVSDKAQARSTGPVVAMTRQPVKGRKKHGGIRLGEMERDSLLSHGASFCLQDRLMNCSDTHVAFVCGQCGGLLSVYNRSHAATVGAEGRTAGHSHGPPGARVRSQYCHTCKSSAAVKPVNMPYVYRYLTNELAAMGIKLKLVLEEF